MPDATKNTTTWTKLVAGALSTSDQPATEDDVRAAAEAANAAQKTWAGLEAHERGEVMYGLAELMTQQTEALAAAIKADDSSRTIVSARREAVMASDRMVCFAGWRDKYGGVLCGACDVAGPYDVTTAPEPMGTAALIAPAGDALLGAVSMLAPALCAGCAVTVLVDGSHAAAMGMFAELCAKADLPAGAINVLMMDRQAAYAALESAIGVYVRTIAQPNRTMHADHVLTTRECDFTNSALHDSPWRIEPYVKMKTIWRSVSAK